MSSNYLAMCWIRVSGTMFLIGSNKLCRHWKRSFYRLFGGCMYVFCVLGFNELNPQRSPKSPGNIRIHSDVEDSKITIIQQAYTLARMSIYSFHYRCLRTFPSINGQEFTVEFIKALFIKLSVRFDILFFMGGKHMIESHLYLTSAKYVRDIQQIKRNLYRKNERNKQMKIYFIDLDSWASGRMHSTRHESRNDKASSWRMWSFKAIPGDQFTSSNWLHVISHRLFISQIVLLFLYSNYFEMIVCQFV